VDSVVVLQADGPPQVVAVPLRQKPDGTIFLGAVDATIHGSSPRYERGGVKDQIGYWGNPRDWVEWEFEADRPGVFTVALTYSCAPGSAGSAFTLQITRGAGTALPAWNPTGRTAVTGGWNQYRTLALGKVTLPAPGRYRLAFRPRTPPPWRHIGLQSITLRPAAKTPARKRP
jgi:hypothetical protein